MLQSICYFENNIQKYWTDENYYGYIYLIYDQKHKMGYVGKKKAKIEKTQNYYGAGKIILNIQNDRGNYFLKKFIIGVCYSKEDLEYWETECKKFFNVLDRKYGYNIVEKDNGGDYITNNPNKKEICKNMSKSAIKRFEKEGEKEKQSQRTKNHWTNLSQEEKEEQVAYRTIKITEAYYNCDEEKFEEWQAKRIERLGSKEVRKKISDGGKLFVKNNPEKVKERHEKAMRAKHPYLEKCKNEFELFLDTYKDFCYLDFCNFFNVKESTAGRFIKNKLKENVIKVSFIGGKTKMKKYFTRS